MQVEQIMSNLSAKTSKLFRLLWLLPVALVFWIVNNITVRHIFKKKMGLIENARVWLMRAQGAKIGTGSAIRKGQFITDFTLLEIGKSSTLGPFSRLFLFDQLTIGDYVEIGSGLTVHTSEHELTNVEEPLGKQGAKRSAVTIQSDVYIGSNVTILAGTLIENRVVIGAGSLVKGHLKSGYLYGGVPVKQIKRLPGTKK